MHPMARNWTRRLGPFNLSGMVCGLCEIVDGLVRFLSLGNIHTNICMKFIFAHAMYEIELHKRRTAIKD